MSIDFSSNSRGSLDVSLWFLVIAAPSGYLKPQPLPEGSAPPSTSSVPCSDSTTGSDPWSLVQQAGCTTGSRSNGNRSDLYNFKPSPQQKKQADTTNSKTGYYLSGPGGVCYSRGRGATVLLPPARSSLSKDPKGLRTH